MVTFKDKCKRILCILLTASVLTAAVFALFLPLPQVYAQQAAERYLFLWEDGRTTEENYASALRCFFRATEEDIVIQRNGVCGSVATGMAYQTLYRRLESRELAELLLSAPAGLTQLERAALYQQLKGRLWYDGEAFCWTGTRFVRTERTQAQELFLLSGAPQNSFLARSGAVNLKLCAGAETTAKQFVGSAVQEVSCSAPYFFRDGGLYRDGAAGRRFVAALPGAESLTVEEADFLDGGALAPCAHLKYLSLPFLDGALLELFGEEIPAEISCVTVRGGKIADNAFYGCAAEVNLCGISAEDVSPHAFEGCREIAQIHSPNAEILLKGRYVSEVMSCGCTLFVRVV